MNKNIAVSVIIPVHNSEKYLESALKSAILQDFDKPFEILIINNDSVDSSESIIQKYASLHEFIRHKVTKGLTANEARLEGIKHAEGEFICFLDSDDFYRLDFLQTMYDKAKKENADIVNCSYVRYFENNKIQKYPFAHLITFDRNQGLNYLLFDIYLRGYMPMKIYKRDLLLNTKLAISKHLTIFEDYLFNFSVYMNVKKTISISTPLYFYRFSPLSITRESSNERPLSKIKCFAGVRYLIEQSGDQNILKYFYRYRGRLWLSISYDIYLSTKNHRGSYYKTKKEICKLYKIITNKKGLEIKDQPWENLINDLKQTL